MKKVAVLMSGQPRLPNFCRPTIVSMFEGVDVDFFIHFWDNITAYPNNEPRNHSDVVSLELSHDVILPSIEQFNPKKYQIESHSRFKMEVDRFIETYKTLISYNKDIETLRKSGLPPHSLDHDCRLLYGTWSQAHSKRQCATMLDNFMTENNVHYDHVFRCRSDLYFDIRTRQHLYNLMNNTALASNFLGEVVINNWGNDVVLDSFYGSGDIQSFIKTQEILPSIAVRNFILSQNDTSNVGLINMETVLCCAVKRFFMTSHPIGAASFLARRRRGLAGWTTTFSDLMQDSVTCLNDSSAEEIISFLLEDLTSVG